MPNPSNPNKYNELFSQARSTYADQVASPASVQKRTMPPDPGTYQAPKQHLNSPKQTNLLGKIIKQAAILLGLALLTIVVLYWQTIYNEADYWWRHLRNTQTSGEIPNALYVGNKAYYELKNDEHPTAPIIPIDNRLVIDKIEVNAPIVLMPSSDEDTVLKSIENGVGHYPETAIPGQAGNVFLTGHSSYWWWNPGQYKFVFQHLEDLVIGDVITVYFDQNKYDYKVREMKVVKPTGEDANHVFDQEPYQNDPILRIMTCVPVGTSLNRLIVTAEQTYPEPGSISSSQPSDETLPIIN